ncbi:MAG TPA: hypothetical protein VFT12_14810 [Thermoanaerobaculia bacterium]|nr:hypothetical protein [Thermoanaerobaculia bacterium]
MSTALTIAYVAITAALMLFLFTAPSIRGALAARRNRRVEELKAELLRQIHRTHAGVLGQAIGEIELGLAEAGDQARRRFETARRSLDQWRRDALRNAGEQLQRYGQSPLWSLRGLMEYNIEMFAGVATDISIRLTGSASSPTAATAESELLGIAEEAFAAIAGVGGSRSIHFWLRYAPDAVTFTITRDGDVISEMDVERLKAVLTQLHQRAEVNGGHCNIASERISAGHVECELNVPYARNGYRHLT